MLDHYAKVNVEGSKFNFNVDAVSGTLHKSTRKSKFCVRDVDGKSYIFDDEFPRLLCGSKEEIVVLQTMLTGKDKILVEYMTRKDYDEMFDGSLPQVDVYDLINEIKDEVEKELRDEEWYDERLRNYTEKDGYYEFRDERRDMARSLTNIITKMVCKRLEEKHIGTFDSSRVR